MDLRTSILIAAALGLGVPGEARAGETPAELVGRVTALRSAGNFADAARLADDNARRDDLDAATRVLLGGLARQNYEQSFDAGGPATDLCKAAAIMRHVAPLDTPKGGESKLKAAADAETKLAERLGPTWTSVCTPAAEPASDEAPETTETAAAAPKPERVLPPKLPVSTPPEDLSDRRRVRAGVGTIVPGLLLFAPMAGLLTYRAAGERDFAALNVDTAGRTPTSAEDARAVALSHRYTATTAGAIVLGVTGAALVVTGAALLATGARQRRMAVAPWGARGLGGLVLHGRF